MQIIQQAVWGDYRLHLTYQSYESSPSDVIIDAYALVSKADKWYLIGRKPTGDYRTYRLTRIIELDQSDDRFERDPSFDLMEYWRTSQKNFRQEMAQEFPVYTVELSVHAKAYWYLIRILEGQFDQISPPNDNHWCRVSVRFNTEYEAKAHILAMGIYAKIISPTHLQDDLKQIIQGVSQHYDQYTSDEIDDI